LGKKVEWFHTVPFGGNDVGELVVAIDIGTSKVCALCGQVNKSGQMETLGKGVVPCDGARKGQISDIEAVSLAIAEALRQVEASAGVKVGSAYINVMGLHVDVFTNRSATTVTNEGREVQKKDVDRLLYAIRNVEVAEGAQIIDIIPRQFVIDGYGGITEPVGMVGSAVELEADIVTGKVTSISNIIKCIENAGIKIDGLVISAEALGEIILTPEEMEMGVILIDVGASVTDVSVFKGGRLSFYESIQVGGDHVTNDISIGMRIPVAEAEKIKREYAIALVSLIRKDQTLYLNDLNDNERKRVRISEIVEVVEARVYEIMAMCRRMLRENRVALDFGAGVVLTGGGIAYFDGNKQIASEVFRLPVKVYPPRIYGNQKIETILAEGIVRHVCRTGRGTKFGSSVQVLKGRESGLEMAIWKKIKAFFDHLF
jgi:cell division protein FtsA